MDARLARMRTLIITALSELTALSMVDGVVLKENIHGKYTGLALGSVVVYVLPELISGDTPTMVWRVELRDAHGKIVTEAALVSDVQAAKFFIETWVDAVLDNVLYHEPASI